MKRRLRTRLAVITILFGLGSLSAITVPLAAHHQPGHNPPGWCRKNPGACETTTSSTTTTGTTTTTTVPTTTTSTTTTAPTTTTSTTTTTTAPTTTTSTTTTTTAPPTSCVGVQVAAGANLVNVANAHGAGTTFCLAAGTYQLSAPIPAESGDRWIGALGSTGQRLSIIDGGWTAARTVSRAFSCTCTNGLIENVIVEDFANPLQSGALSGPATTGWTYRNIEARENQGFGVHMHNSTRLLNSFIHHNNQAGVGGNGDNTLVEGNEISWNNDHGNIAPGWEAGGSKWVNTVNLTVRNNYVHDNVGPGLWTDGSNVNTLYENNRVTGNMGAGIFHELGGTALIQNNEVWCNKGAGEIYIANSRGTSTNPILVKNNIVGEHCNPNVASLAAKDDPNRSPRLGYVRFENNQVTAENRLAGIFGVSPWVAPEVTFISNDYFSDLYGSGGSGWRVSDILLTWEQWRARGYDLAGTRQPAPG